MDPQVIIDACEADWDANKSDCNHFVKAVATTLGVGIFNDGDDADAILDKLAASADWTAFGSRDDAIQAAASGQFIVAGLRSKDFTPPRNHGHVVVIVKGEDPNHPGYPLAYWGMLGGVGQEDSSIRNSFKPGSDLDRVEYFGRQIDSVAQAVIRGARSLSLNVQSESVGAAAESLLGKLVETLNTASLGAKEGEGRLFFPNGIELISLEVKAGPVDVTIKIAGPKAGA